MDIEPPNPRPNYRNAVFVIAGLALALGAYLYFGDYAALGKSFGKIAALARTSFADIFSREGDFSLRAKIDRTADVSGADGTLPPAREASALSGSADIVSAPTAPAEPAPPKKKKIIPVEAEPQAAAAAASVPDARNSAPEASAPKFAPAEIKECAFDAANEPNHKAVFNELAWMGSPAKSGEGGAQAGNNEWVELRNNFGSRIDLSGWSIRDSSGSFKIVFAEGSVLPEGQLYLLERTDDGSVPGVTADAIYSGVLANAGMRLRLFDQQCVLSDEIDARAGWPGGDNATKQTLERDIADFGWHTSLLAGGTPKMRNSDPPKPLAGTEPPAPAPADVAPPAAVAVNPEPTSTPPAQIAAVDHLVIVEVQIAGASTTNDFIKIYNPTGAALDISGWKLRKRTKSGSTDYSVRVFPAASTIAADGNFLWANSAGGFSATLGANVSSSESLAADNSIALLDPANAIVDALAWGSGHTNPYMEGSAYTTNPAAGQVLKRKWNGSTVQDLNDNAADFAL